MKQCSGLESEPYGSIVAESTKLVSWPSLVYLKGPRPRRYSRAEFDSEDLTESRSTRQCCFVQISSLLHFSRTSYTTGCTQGAMHPLRETSMMPSVSLSQLLDAMNAVGFGGFPSKVRNLLAVGSSLLVIGCHSPGIDHLSIYGTLQPLERSTYSYALERDCLSIGMPVDLVIATFRNWLPNSDSSAFSITNPGATLVGRVSASRLASWEVIMPRHSSGVEGRKIYAQQQKCPTEGLGTEQIARMYGNASTVEQNGSTTVWRYSLGREGQSLRLEFINDTVTAWSAAFQTLPPSR